MVRVPTIALGASEHGGVRANPWRLTARMASSSPRHRRQVGPWIATQSTGTRAARRHRPAEYGWRGGAAHASISSTPPSRTCRTQQRAPRRAVPVDPGREDELVLGLVHEPGPWIDDRRLVGQAADVADGHGGPRYSPGPQREWTSKHVAVPPARVGAARRRSRGPTSGPLPSPRRSSTCPTASARPRN